MSKKYNMVKTGSDGHLERYRLMPSAFSKGYSNTGTVSEEYTGDSSLDFDDFGMDDDITPMTANVGEKSYKYIPYGDADDLPDKILKKLFSNEVTSEGMNFNVLTCYGRGVRFIDRKTKKDTDDEEIREFCLTNSIHELFLQLCTDMKFFFFNVTEIILSRDRSRIVRMQRLDASMCRLQKKEDGKINNVLYGNFSGAMLPGSNVRAIPLLDVTDPLGDLLIRQGKEDDPKSGKIKSPENCTKYAILTRFPTPGCRYYPMPYYLSIFRDDWYDIYKLISLGKKYLIKNTSAPRMQIEVHEDYWDNLCDYENIIGENERKARIDEEKQRIIDFVCGYENAGKAMISGYYVDPNGKENRMVRFVNINEGNKKEGGDWSDDMQEASNALCFSMGVHPNLIGATPGKTAMNNSGSDKRELFNLKQSLETAPHDIMLKPFHVVLHYNGWADRYTVDVPIIQLTTLDEGKSQKKKSVNNESNDNENE